MTKVRRAYKDTTLQQLRSFCETARLGSMSAAAQALGLAQPTVWKQVRALERTMGVPLVVVKSRVCRLTSQGQILAELAQPALGTVVSLRRLLLEKLEEQPPRLTVAASPRILSEDFPPCIVEFEKRRPNVELSLREVLNDEVFGYVETGAADLGFTPLNRNSTSGRSMNVEWCYDLDPILLLPPKHPLGTKKRISLRDLQRLPLVNAPSSFPDPRVAELLTAHGLFNAQPRRVEAFYATAIERYVELGFGYGLIGRAHGLAVADRPTRRNVSGLFGRSPVFLVKRPGVSAREVEDAFLAVVRERLQRP